MAYKDKNQQREYQRKLMEKKRKGLTEGLTKQPEALDSTPQSVRPDVTPTMADVEANKAWVVLTGPFKGEIRWHGPLAQSWKNVPCEIVDGVCVAEHYEGRHVVPQPHDDGAVERARARLR